MDDILEIAGFQLFYLMKKNLHLFMFSSEKFTYKILENNSFIEADYML